MLEDASGCTTAVPSLAATALAPTGGIGSSVVENYCKDGVEFTRAESRVCGSRLGSRDVFSTQADVYITNLTLFGRLKIALMQASLTSTRDANQADSLFDFHATFRGVTVDGDEVVPALDVDLGSCGTYDDFARVVRGRSDDYAQRFDYEKQDLLDALNARTPVRGSYLERAEVPRHLVKPPKGYAVHIPGYGKLHLAEFLFKHGRRRINLVRLQFGETLDFDVVEKSGEAGERLMMPMVLSGDPTTTSGSPSGGSMTVGSVEGNGSPIMPAK
jgi:hypothetical protein